MPEDKTKPAVDPSATGDQTATKAVTDRLLSQSDIISSQATGLENKIQEAIGGVKTGQKASAARIESAANREIGFAKEQFAQQKTTFKESGGAFNRAALDAIDTRTEKSLRDLEQRKQELILQGESSAASNIANLQVQQIQFQMQAQQQVFQNLLGISGIEQQQQSLGIQKAAQTQAQTQFEQRMKFDENAAMSSIALQYGLQVGPGENLSDLYSRATKDMGANSPAALSIKQAQANINASNARIAEAKANIDKANREAKSLSSTDIETLANLYANNPDAGGAVLANIKDPAQLINVLDKASLIQTDQQIQAYVTSGATKEEAKVAILNDPNLKDKPGKQKSLLEKIDKTTGWAQPAAPGLFSSQGISEAATGISLGANPISSLFDLLK